MITDKTTPGSIEISKLELTNYDGSKKIDITPLVREFNVYESFATNFISVDFFIEDALSLTTVMPIVGEEKIAFSFKTPHPSFEKGIELDLRVVSILDMGRDKARSAYYIIKCVPPQMIKDMKTKVRKAYMNKPINQMINELTNEFLDIETIIESEETEGTRTLVIPNMNPTRAINFLCKEAKSTKNPASNYRFFQDCDGFHFKTIDSCIQPESGKVNVAFVDRYFASDADLNRDEKDAKNLFGDTPVNFGKKDTKPRDFLKLNKFTFMNLGNYFNSGRYGALESKIRLLDPVTSSYTEKRYNFKANSKDFKKTSSEGKGFDLLTENADYFSEESESRVFFLLTDSGQNNGSIEADQKEDMLHLKVASEFLFENILVNVTIPGDSEKRIGQKIIMDFPEYGATDDIEGSINKYISGEYIILSLRHIYNNNGYVTAMICSKNCYEQEISHFESTTQEVR